MKLKELTNHPFLKTKYVPRYSSFQLKDPETLSDHITEMSTLAVLLYHELDKKLNGNASKYIDRGELLEKCIVHDLDEVFSNDIIRPVKYSVNGLKHMIDEAMGKIIRYHELNLTGTNDMTMIWSTSKDGLTGLIVKVLDLVVVSIKIYKEVELKNNFEMYNTVKSCINSLKDCGVYVEEFTRSLRKKDNNYYIIEYELSWLIRQSIDILKELDKKEVCNEDTNN